MSKGNLFFDFDGMKFDTLPHQVSYVNNRYQINTSLSEHINNGDSLNLLVSSYLKNTAISRDDFYRDIVENFHSSISWHENVLPMEDMCEVMPQLAKKFNLYTVTARPQAGKHVIQHLLDKHIPNCIREMHCVWGYMKGVGPRGEISKKDFIQSVRGENVAFLDDSPNEIKKMQGIIPSYLFDPMNLHENEGMNRVSAWKEIGELFL